VVAAPPSIDSCLYQFALTKMQVKTGIK